MCCDANSVATVIVLEIVGVKMQYVVWLRKNDDFSSINIAKLGAILNGINLVLKQGLCDVEIQSDLVTHLKIID